MYSCEDCDVFTGFEASACKEPGKAQWESLHIADTVDCTAALKVYPKVPHLRLVNALCMECARWGMCVLGYFLLLSPHL